MKTITTREFYHTPSLVKRLPPGRSVLVTDNDRAAFVVTRTGKRPVKTADDLRREAKEMFPNGEPKVNFTAVLKELKR